MAVNPWAEFHGTWNVVSSEHMEDFLGEVGVPWPVRKIASSVKSHVTMKVDGDKIKIQVVSTFHTQPENEFHINGEETTANFGKHKYKAKATWEDGKLIVQLSPSEDGTVKGQKVTRQIVNGEMHQTMEIGNVVAKQRHTKAAEK